MGAGGAGMSALARLLAERGCVVTACDASPSATLAALGDAQIETFVGHDPRHVIGVDVLTASPAVPADHPELREAPGRGARVLSRAEALAALGEAAPLVGFAGTHGKTTTASMAAHVWTAAGRDPSWLIGAPVRPLGAGGRWRDGTDLIAEVDESYGTSALVVPAVLGLVAADPDHLDHFGDAGAMERAYADLVARTRGPVIARTDDDAVRRVIAAAAPAELHTVGRTAAAGSRITTETLSAKGSRWRLETPFGAVEVSLGVLGRHNVDNAAIAAVAALARGIAPADVAAGLAAFPGAPRRLERVGAVGRTVVIDDYAHLPEEVAAAIAAARDAGYDRVGVVFQPHRVTRTKALAPRFARSFDGATAVVVTELYPAGEANPDRVSGALVADAVRGGGSAPTVTFAATLAAATAVARRWLSDLDAVLVLGAGDVGDVATALVSE